MTRIKEEQTTIGVTLGLPTPAPFTINYMHRWAGKIEEYWPRRLLHIDSLTSHERGENNTYGGISQPDYVVLSYTWGRFENHQSEQQNSLPIKNVPWKIPVIKESHFTVEQLLKVLKRMSSWGAQWAWIDIACIHQEDEAIKMDEIGKQAAIFQKALRAFVWLSHVSSDSLSKAAATIDTLSIWFRFGNRHDFSYAGEPEAEGHDIINWPSWKEVCREKKLIVLKTLSEAFDVILADPWFRSLWTLQEVTMRNDAIILSDHGDLVASPWPDNYGRRKLYLMTEWSNNWNTLRSHLVGLLAYRGNGTKNDDGNKISGHTDLGVKDKGQDDILRSSILDIINRITATGFPDLSTDNPHVQYGSAHNRTAANEVDRIYGIMQIYNVRVGQAIRPSDRPTLPELVLEFAVELNVRSPLMGQLFVHTASIETFPSWCITEQSTVPAAFQNCGSLEEQSKATYRAPRTLVITGKMCLFIRLLETYDGHVRQDRLRSPFSLDIYPDNDVAKMLQPDGIPMLTWMSHQERVGMNISKVFDPEDLYVLKLGILEMVNVSLLLRKVRPTQMQETESPYVRLGLCLWMTLPADRQRPAWQQAQSQYEAEKKYSMEMEALFTDKLDVKVV